MIPVIFRISDSIAIQSYGLAIAIGLIIFIYLTYNNPLRKKLVDKDNFLNLIFYSIIAGIAGGRILAVINSLNSYNFLDIFKIYNGGFSILGSIIGVSIFIFSFLKIKKIDFKLLDLLCVYAPLLQCISRMGCLLSGCCYGKITNLPWAIKYLNSECSAPVGLYLHPTQIYSSLILLSFFILFKAKYKSWIETPGKFFSFYLILSALERFSVDFLRGDREFLNSKILIFKILSITQIIALSIIFLVILRFIILKLSKYKIKL